MTKGTRWREPQRNSLIQWCWWSNRRDIIQIRHQTMLKNQTVIQMQQLTQLANNIYSIVPINSSQLNSISRRYLMQLVSLKYTDIVVKFSMSSLKLRLKIVKLFLKKFSVHGFWSPNARKALTKRVNTGQTIPCDSTPPVRPRSSEKQNCNESKETWISMCFFTSSWQFGRQLQPDIPTPALNRALSKPTASSGGWMLAKYSNFRCD